MDRLAFQLFTMEQTAEQLGICVRTLRDHVRRGDLAFIEVGQGKTKPRRLFHPDDLMAFVNRQRRTEPSCQSTSQRARISSSTTFNSEVVDFAEVRAQRRDEKRKGSSASARRKPPTSSGKGSPKNGRR